MNFTSFTPKTCSLAYQTLPTTNPMECSLHGGEGFVASYPVSISFPNKHWNENGDCLG